MFIFIDWAVYSLAQPAFKQTALLLYASSYVTWTFQTHTFSNAIESILVCLTIIAFLNFRRSRSVVSASGALTGFLTSFGFFLRITFPAFILPVVISAIPAVYERPTRLLLPAFTFTVVTFAAIYFDTIYYSQVSSAFSLHWKLSKSIIITPLNNLLYNSSNRNLATHGIHPLYTHLIVNLPSLIGPGVFLPCLSNHLSLKSIIRLLTKDYVFLCAVSGILLLSAKPHQEARFLLPAVPLLLISFSQFYPRAGSKTWLTFWIVFNTAAGIFMGSFHQCGVVPSLEYLSNRLDHPREKFCGKITESALAMPQMTKVIWWRTYTCPKWVFGHANNSQRKLVVRDLGGSIEALKNEIGSSVSVWHGDAILDTKGTCDAWALNNGKLERTFIVAPLSALPLNNNNNYDTNSEVMMWGKVLYPVTTIHHHVNLDDVDLKTDSVKEILNRVAKQRGLGIFLLSSQ